MIYFTGTPDLCPLPNFLYRNLYYSIYNSHKCVILSHMVLSQTVAFIELYTIYYYKASTPHPFRNPI